MPSPFNERSGESAVLQGGDVNGYAPSASKQWRLFNKCHQSEEATIELINQPLETLGAEPSP